MAEEFRSQNLEARRKEISRKDAKAQRRKVCKKFLRVFAALREYLPP
jgi:hypothetical protein